jgi:D-sedoheptulose 7-phosphate isomerase
MRKPLREKRRLFVTIRKSNAYKLGPGPGSVNESLEMKCVNKPNVASVNACLGPAARTPEEYFAVYQQTVANLPYPDMEKAIREIMAAYERGSSIFTFGNGGSAALASHFACDLSKGTLIGENGEKRFRVIALTDNCALITAWANDHGYDQIFAQQLKNLVAAGDLVFAISGSGSSPNVLEGLEVAHSHGARTIGLTGFDGGKMKGMCDVCVVLPSHNMQIIEDFHLSVTHAISSVIRRKVFEGLAVQRMAVSGMAG